MGEIWQDRIRGLKWWVVRVVSGGEVEGLEDFLRGKKPRQSFEVRAWAKNSINH